MIENRHHHNYSVVSSSYLSRLPFDHEAEKNTFAHLNLLQQHTSHINHCRSVSKPMAENAIIE